MLSEEGKLRIKRLVSRKTKKSQNRSSIKGTHCGTFLPFVGADGTTLATYFVFAAKFHEGDTASVRLDLPNTPRRTRSTQLPCLIFFTESGYINDVVFQLIMDDFVSKWNSLHPGVECICFGDNLGAHRQIRVVQKAFENQVSLCFLVAHTSHWSQPLDNLLFASLKLQVTKITHERAYLQTFSSANLFSFVDFVTQASKKAFTVNTITKAFKETGLYPFSEEKILQLAKENHMPGGVDAGWTPTTEHEYLIEKMTQKVGQVVEKTVEKASEEGKKVRKVSLSVRKNRGYDPVDMMEEERKRQVEKKIKEKEKELAKEQKADERQKKKERRANGWAVNIVMSFGCVPPAIVSPTTKGR